MSSYKRLFAALLAVALVMAATSSAQAKLTDEEKELVKRINQFRKSKGLPALRVHEKLVKCSQDYARQMASAKELSHTLFGTTPPGRAEKAGYKGRFVTENVAAGQVDPKETVTDWSDSGAHERNMLVPDGNEIGVGIGIADDGEKYWIMVVGEGD